ncbi:hypothetical protein HMPREF3034_02135 [Prevotella sp. DNF00663]|nr:hypothetical protein HMPREF3034_02135 [Prevotella sp. DNF00663]
MHPLINSFIYQLAHSYFSKEALLACCKASSVMLHGLNSNAEMPLQQTQRNIDEFFTCFFYTPI